MSNSISVQPKINMGIVGHVDHGKTTLTKLLSGKWTDTHSEEKKRGITIKLGYTNFTIFSKDNSYSIKDLGGYTPLKKISIVDAPGHESFMATMISGAAVMDCALLLVAANEKCPQPQTIEHLKTLELSGIKDIIVIQNKIDLVNKEEAIENYREIKEFLKGTIAENSPILPVSAQHGANLGNLLKYINTKFSEPKRDNSLEPRMYIVRSFDINKPGISFKEVRGGVLGGAIKQGIIKEGDELEIRPGLKKMRDGKPVFEPIYVGVKGLKSDTDYLEQATSGGSIAVMTELDPVVTKSDSLVGQIAGLKGSLPEPSSTISFTPNLFEKVITSTEDYEVKPIYSTEPLMLIVNSMTTVGLVTSTKKNIISMGLKRPVMAFPGDRAVIFRRFEGNKWRIIGYGIVE